MIDASLLRMRDRALATFVEIAFNIRSPLNSMPSSYEASSALDASYEEKKKIVGKRSGSLRTRCSSYTSVPDSADGF